VICKQCGKEFEGQRATAKYCSPQCRKLAFLSVPEGGIENAKKEVSVPKLDRDNIHSENYDTTGEGFARRNKNWPDFKEAFRQDTMEACKRINHANVIRVAENVARREKIASADMVA